MYEQKRFLKNAQLFEIQKVLHRFILPSRMKNYSGLYLYPELTREYALLTEGLLCYGELPDLEARLHQLKLIYSHLGALLVLIKLLKLPPQLHLEPQDKEQLISFLDRTLQEICTLDYHLRLLNDQKPN